METEGVDSWAMTEDRSSCEIRGVTPNRDKYDRWFDYTGGARTARLFWYLETITARLQAYILC